MSVIKKPEQLLKPLDFPRKLLLGPGPSNCPPRVLAAGSLPLLGHMHPEFLQVMDDVKLGLQYLFQTTNRITLAVTGTGHCAMETAIINLIEPGDAVLVAVNGLWGERAFDVASRNGVEVKKMNKSPGEAFTLEEMETEMKKHKPSVFFLCHSESSTGVLQPLEGVGHLCRRYSCLLIVDCVASLGSVPIQTDELGIDVIYSGSQKVVAAPPGVSLISFGPRAMAKVASRKTKVRSFYLDINELANYWGCDNSPRRYHHTGAITSIYQLREALSLIVEEGLENVIGRHRVCSEMLQKGLQRMGLRLFVKNEKLRLPTITTIEVPSEFEWKKVVEYCMKNYRLEIAGGLGPTAGKVWRIGLMGYNCTPHNANYALRVFEEALNRNNYNTYLTASKL